MACGSSHTLAVLVDGTTWSWGDGDYGKLGHGDVSAKNAPTMVEMLSCHVIKKIDAGEEFCICLTNTGRILSWGRHNGNVLGHGDDGHLNFPLIITALEEVTIVDISAGAQHCLSLSSNGDVYAWGSNNERQLGLGHADPIILPQRVDYFVGKKAKQISAGSSHSVVWTTDPSEWSGGSIALPLSTPERYKSLQQVELSSISRRMFVLKQVTEQFLSSFPLLETSSQSLSRLGVKDITNYLLPKQKQKLFRKLLGKTSVEDSEIKVQTTRESVLFLEYCKQLQPVDAKELRGNFHPFKIRMPDEIVAMRDLQSDLVKQLHSGEAHILIPALRSRVEGEHPVQYVFSSHQIESRSQRCRFSFLGRLMGMSIRTRTPLPLQLAFPMYKLLAREQLQPADLWHIDEPFMRAMDLLVQSELSPSEFEASLKSLDFPLVTMESSGPVPLTYDTRQEYASVVIRARLTSWDEQALRISHGMRDIIPVNLLCLMTPHNFQESFEVPQ